VGVGLLKVAQRCRSREKKRTGPGGKRPNRGRKNHLGGGSTTKKRGTPPKTTNNEKKRKREGTSPKG